MPICTAVLAEFDAEMPNTRKLLEVVPEDKYSYRPHEKSMTLIRLASHVAQLPGWAVETLHREKLELMPGQAPYIAKSNAELLAEFDKNVSAARAAIEEAKDGDFSVPWSLVYGGHTVFTMPRAAVLRTVVMNHLIHHRAQLGVYLRMNDVAIPGMYGPSADDQAATAGS
jgi:uncharacterized damage-inducible protein DinB